MSQWAETYKFMEICPDVKVRHAVFEVPGGASKRMWEILTPKTGRAFRSIFLYDASYSAFIGEHHTNAGYPGVCWSDGLTIDLDDDGSVEEAQGVARRLVDRLSADFEVNPKSIHIAFSGRKGFHISLPQEIIGFAPSQTLGKTMKKFVAKLFDIDGLAPGATGEEGAFFLAGDAQTTKIDLSIYKVNGLIRVGGSKHEKTGNFKIYISEKELFDLTADEIKELSKDQRKRTPYDPPKRCKTLEEIWLALEAEQSKPVERARIAVPVIGGVEIRTDQRMCMQRIMNDHVPDGEGDERAIRLASHFAGLGTPPDIVEGIMLSWNDKMEKPMARDQIASKVRSAMQSKYYYGCDDPILASVCDTRCFKYKDAEAAQDNAKHIQSVSDLKEKFISVIRDRRGIGFGIDQADYYCRRILPGEVCIEVACSGSGKTTIMMDQIVKLRKETGKPMLFLQQELHDVAIMERIVRHSSGIDIVEVEDRYKACQDNGDMTPIENVFNRAVEKYEGVYFCTLDNLSTKQKIDLIKAAQTKLGPLGAVFEDYIGRGNEPGVNFSEILTRLAMGIKRAAKECDVPYFCAAQAKTEKGLDASMLLDANSIRDSRQVFINADFVIGFSRPHHGHPELGRDDFLLAQIIKNRRGRDNKSFRLDADFVRGEFHARDALPVEDLELAARAH